MKGLEQGLASWVQEIVTGSNIFLAVTLEELRHRRPRKIIGS